LRSAGGPEQDQFKQIYGDLFRCHKSGWVYYDMHNDQDLENLALSELIELTYKYCC